MRTAALAFALSAVAAEPASKPYSLIEVATLYDEQGVGKPEYRMLRAVNSSGTVVIQDLSPEAGGLRQILDQSQLSNTIVDPVKRTATTARFGRTTRREEGNCTERFVRDNGSRWTVRPAAEHLNGILTDRITVEREGWRGEWWIAPAFGCTLLRTEDYQRGRLFRRVEATDIQTSEPDPKLFEVPFDYTYTQVKPFMSR